MSILSDNDRTMIITMDFIGATPSVTKKAYQKAKAKGLRTELKNIVVSASHTHSGYGAISEEDIVFQVAPAIDLYVPE
jgi:hypothetical protein